MNLMQVFCGQSADQYPAIVAAEAMIRRKNMFYVQKQLTHISLPNPAWFDEAGQEIECGHSKWAIRCLREGVGPTTCELIWSGAIGG